MCLSVGPAEEFRVYKTTEDIRVMAQTGRSSFIHGLVNYFFDGNFSYDKDGVYPKMLCDMNYNDGNFKIHGMTRFFVMWELVLCSPERFLELQSSTSITSVFSENTWRQTQYFHAVQKSLYFDWTSLTLLKPDFQPQPTESLFDIGQDRWKSSPSEIEVFRQKTFAVWNASFKYPLESMQEYMVINQLEKSIQQTVLRYSPILSDIKNKKVMDIIKYQLQSFGNVSEVALKQCKSLQIPQSELLVHETRKNGYIAVKNALFNVLSHLCDTLVPLAFNNVSLTGVQDILEQLKFDMHWSVLEKCEDCRYEDCFVGMPDRPSPDALVIKNVCLAQTQRVTDAADLIFQKP